MLLPLLAVPAALVLVGPAGAAEPVYTLDPLSHKLKIRPHKLSFRDLEMTDPALEALGQEVRPRARDLAHPHLQPELRDRRRRDHGDHGQALAHP
jgi:hypothetical protein